MNTVAQIEIIERIINTKSGDGNKFNKLNMVIGIKVILIKVIVKIFKNNFIIS